MVVVVIPEREKEISVACICQAQNFLAFYLSASKHPQPPALASNSCEKIKESKAIEAAPSQ